MFDEMKAKRKLMIAYWLLLVWSVLPCVIGDRSPVMAAGMKSIHVSADGSRFVLEGTDITFTPWGFNYDHDENGRLLEDYWDAEWPKVEEDFREMKELGANVVRIHLQTGKFMPEPWPGW
jgi:hypothetical protein